MLYDYDDYDDPLATPGEALDEYARNAGAEQPEQPWISMPWDVWQHKPSYRGPPMPHPEDHGDDEPFEMPRPRG